MKNIDDRQKFIELRARGFSYDKIVPQVGTSKPTLIKWNEELREPIERAKQLFTDSLLERVMISDSAKLEIYGKKLNEIYTEIGNADLSKLNMRDLLQLKDTLENEVEKQNPKHQQDMPQVIINLSGGSNE
jgi:intein-encoded DNA endonuclease-like protein